MMQVTTDRVWVHVRDLEVYGYHGVPDAEQEIGHRLRIQIRMELNSCPATHTDSVQDTIDYGSVAKLVTDIATSTQYRTLERLGSTILDRLFREFERLESLELEIEKPMPPAPVMAAAVGVRLVRNRAA